MGCVRENMQIKLCFGVKNRGVCRKNTKMKF